LSTRLKTILRIKIQIGGAAGFKSCSDAHPIKKYIYISCVERNFQAASALMRHISLASYWSWQQGFGLQLAGGFAKYV
jgi:hypothetical protein